MLRIDYSRSWACLKDIVMLFDEKWRVIFHEKATIGKQ